MQYLMNFNILCSNQYGFRKNHSTALALIDLHDKVSTVFDLALVYNYIFFRTAVLRKLFDIRFSYKHCNFSSVCLLVKMASKTVRLRDRVYLQNQFLFSHVLWSHAICLRLLDCRKIIACLLAN